MQIPLKWVKELVNIDFTNLNDLIEKLTLGGFEVEEIIELEIENQNQIALDISATANRSDSLSIQGISMEVATLFEKPTKISNYSLKTFDWKEQFKNSVKKIYKEDNYSTFIALVTKNVNNFTVPKWIKQKLISSGLTPSNTLTDFQNYILLETGYPLSVYDFDKICSDLSCSNFKLSISEAESNVKFIATNDITYELDSSNLILKANNLALSIAGIIENIDYSCSESTTSLLIEGSIFNAATIRRQSRNLGVRTDRSARYEKSLKDTYLIEAIYRLISLLKISNPNLICKLHTFYQVPQQTPVPISLRYQTIKEILGPARTSIQKEFSDIAPKTITKYLNRLNFKFSYDNVQLIWEVLIPQYRSDDITREIDLIEEIGRLHGFNNFLTVLPKIKTIGKEDPSYQTRKKITSCLLNLGFNELIHYSLINKTTFINNEIKLINPLLSDCSHLRISLLPNLITTVQENLKQGNPFVEGFEYGHVFSGDIEINFKEKEFVAGIFGGIKTKLTWSDSEKPISWFEAKGKLEQLFKQLNLLIYWTSSEKNTTILHPYRNADLYLANGVKLGIFGQIHPLLSNKLSLSPHIYLFEFDLELIQSQIQINKLAIYKEYSLYPKIVKDLSFIVQQDMQFKDLQKALYWNGTKFLSEINLLDEYRGKSIPDGYISLCFQLVFQSKEKTLEKKEIEHIMNHLQSILINKFDAIIRN
jgi:phenylalanyl-tRNA synthetase beta chain